MVEELQERIARLERRIEEQRQQLAEKEAALRERNLSLDALHHVWCDGGCLSGVHRWTEGRITEDLVRQAEREVRRLRKWWNNRRFIDAYHIRNEKPYAPVTWWLRIKVGAYWWWFWHVRIPFCKWRQRNRPQ